MCKALLRTSHSTNQNLSFLCGIQYSFTYAWCSQKQGSSGADQFLLQQQHQQQRPVSQSNEARLFQKYDVLCTSYHVITSRVDLHLCDDTPLDKGDKSLIHKQSFYVLSLILFNLFLVLMVNFSYLHQVKQYTEYHFLYENKRSPMHFENHGRCIDMCSLNYMTKYTGKFKVYLFFC